jgi:hypothetical protein
MDTELDFLASSSGSDSDRQQRERYLETIKQIPPSNWITNHWAESQAYYGVLYPIVNSLCRAMSSSNVTIMKRKRTQAKATTSIKKAMTQAGGQETDDKWEPVDENDDIYHQCKIFERPNPRQSIGDVLHESCMQFLLTGSDYTWKVPNGYGEPCELYVVPTCLTQPFPISQYYPHGAWRVTQPALYGQFTSSPVTSQATGTVLPAEQVMVNRNPHPWAQWDGYSTLQATSVQRDILAQIDIARLASSNQGVNPTGFIETPVGTNADAVKQLQLKIEQVYAGAKNSGKIPVLMGGAKFSPWSRTLNDLGGVEVWEQLVTFLCSVMNIPKEIVGLVSATTYATYFAALKQFYTNTLLPECRKRGQFWTRELILPFWGPDYRVQIDPPAIDDKEEQRARLDIAIKAKSITKGKLNSLLGLPLFGDERDDEIAGDPSAAEREMKEKELTISAQKNQMQAERVQAKNGMPSEGDDGAGTPPVNTAGKGALGGAMRSHQLNGRESVLRAFDESKIKRDDEGQFSETGGGGSSGEKKEGGKKQIKVFLPKNSKKWSVDQVNGALSDIGMKRGKPQFDLKTGKTYSEVEFEDGTKRKMSTDEIVALIKQHMPSEGKVKKAIVVGKNSHANGYTNGVLKAFSESDHPRDDHGRFVSKDEMDAAKNDPDKAEELLSRVTDPEQRAKLEKELGTQQEQASKKEYTESPDKLDPVDDDFLTDGVSNESLDDALSLLETDLGQYETVTTETLSELKEKIPQALVADVKQYADTLRKYGADKAVDKANRKADAGLKSIATTIDRASEKVAKIDEQIATIQKDLLTDDPSSFDFEEWASEKIPELNEEEFFANHIPEEPNTYDFGIPEDADFDELEDTPTPEWLEYQAAQKEWEATKDKVESQFERLTEERNSQVEKMARAEERKAERANDRLYDLRGDREEVLSSLDEKIKEKYDDLTGMYYNIFLEDKSFEKYYPEPATK